MITSLLMGGKTKTLLIGGAVLVGLIALASASSSQESKPALNGTSTKKKTSKAGKKSATIKI